MIDVRYIPRTLSPVSPRIVEIAALIPLICCGVILAALVGLYRRGGVQEASGWVTAIVVLVLLVALVKCAPPALDYLLFRFEGGTPRLLPAGLQFRDRWFRRVTVPWSELRRFPNGEEIYVGDENGKELILKPRSFIGHIDQERFLDTIGHYRPDLASYVMRDYIQKTLQESSIVDYQSASDLIDKVEDTTVISFRYSDRPCVSNHVESVIFCPEGVIKRGKFTGSPVATIPWSVITDISFVDGFAGRPGPNLILWRETGRMDRAIFIMLDGITNLEAIAAVIYRHRPDLDPIGESQRRIQAWEERSTAGF